MEVEYTTVFVINISKVFKGFGELRELICEHAPWSWGGNDRTLITPESFKQYFERLYRENDIAATDDFGPWDIVRERIDKLVYADRKPRDGSQNDHYIDLEN